MRSKIPQLTAKKFLRATTKQQRSGQTALMNAAGSGKLDCVKLLLDAGADFSVKDKEGQTALSLAQPGEQSEVVKLLKSRGAPE